MGADAGGADAGAAGAGGAGRPPGPASAILVAAAALGPWLAVLPLGGAAAVAAHATILAAAMHGAGLALARFAGWQRVHPMLAIQWGLASLVGLLGIAIALGAGGIAVQAVLVHGFAAVHTAALAGGFTRYRERAAALIAPGTARLAWLAPACLLAAIGVLHVLGGAGDLGARPFDDDGHLLAQLQRLRETGALADPIGYARESQLGGQLALGALATFGGDVHLVRMTEGLAFVLALGLALARLRPPGARLRPPGARLRPRGAADATSGLWGMLAVIAGGALAYVRPDPATCWTAVGLVLALCATLADRAERAAQADRASPGPRAALPIAVLAGALAALRLELAPVAAAALAAAWWPDRRGPHRLAGLAILAAGALAVVGPYAAARSLAWSSVPAAARALVAPELAPLPVRLAIFAGVALACAPLAAAARHSALRWLAAGAGLAIAGVASELTGDRPYAATLLMPLAIACGLAIAVQIASHKRLAAAALLGSLVLAVVVHEGRTSTGRRRWVRRYLDLASNIEYLRHAGDPAPMSGGYAPVLRDAPAGATIAAWVARPERLDYAAHRIIDLRTPRTAWLRDFRWDPHPSPVAALLGLVRADFLLLEADDLRVERARNTLYRLRCTGPDAAPCPDDLEAIALRYPVVAEAGGVRLVDLRPSRGAR